MALTKKLPPRFSRGGFVLRRGTTAKNSPRRKTSYDCPSGRRSIPLKIRSSGKFHFRRAKLLLDRINFPTRLHFYIFVSANETIQFRKTKYPDPLKNRRSILEKPTSNPTRKPSPDPTKTNRIPILKNQTNSDPKKNNRS